MKKNFCTTHNCEICDAVLLYYIGKDSISSPAKMLSFVITIILGTQSFQTDLENNVCKNEYVLSFIYFNYGPTLGTGQIFIEPLTDADVMEHVTA